MATGVLGAMAGPLLTAAGFVVGVVVALLRQIVIVLWKLLCLVGSLLRRIADGIIDHGVVIILAGMSLALFVVGGVMVCGKVTELMANHGAHRETTKEERAFGDAREAANESAEDLGIAERLREMLGENGEKSLSVNGHSFKIAADPVWVTVTIGGVDAFRQADTPMARDKGTGPEIYRGLGEWEHMLDAAERWIKQQEVDEKFGGLPEDSP